jgi:addiction module RelE/StbE family toxin
MNLIRHRIFKKHFKARILSNRALINRFEARLKMFLKNPRNPVLKDHQLTGRWKNFRAFWVAGDVRVVYWLQGGTLYLYDIGSHNQVY